MGKPVIIGDATLYLGDCLEILPGLGWVDAVVTDPNYGIGESGRKNKTRGKPFGSRVDGKNTRGTYVPPNDYGDYVWDETPADPTAIAWCANITYSIIWGGNFFDLPKSSKWLVWDKVNSGDFADCELAWTNLPGAVRQFRHMWNGMLRASERNTPRVHPTQKPIALMRWCIEQLPDCCETICDPFMGSASTGVACAEMGRKFIGIEKNEHYFDVACKRIEAAQAQGKLFEEPRSNKQTQESLL